MESSRDKVPLFHLADSSCKCGKRSAWFFFSWAVSFQTSFLGFSCINQTPYPSVDAQLVRLSFCQLALHFSVLIPTASTCSRRREKSTGKQGEDWSSQKLQWPSHACREHHKWVQLVKERKRVLRPLIFQWHWWTGLWAGLGPFSHWQEQSVCMHCPLFWCQLRAQACFTCALSEQMAKHDGCWVKTLLPNQPRTVFRLLLSLPMQK